MSRVERCDRCRFFYSALGERQCRRKPPSVFPAQSGPHLAWMGTWPPTTEEKWCGKFKPVKAVES